MMSELESIDEVELSDKFESSHKRSNDKESPLYDIDDEAFQRIG